MDWDPLTPFKEGPPPTISTRTILILLLVYVLVLVLLYSFGFISLGE